MLLAAALLLFRASPQEAEPARGTAPAAASAGRFVTLAGFVALGVVVAYPLVLLGWLGLPQADKTSRQPSPTAASPPAEGSA